MFIRHVMKSCRVMGISQMNGPNLTGLVLTNIMRAYNYLKIISASESNIYLNPWSTTFFERTYIILLSEGIKRDNIRCVDYLFSIFICSIHLNLKYMAV